MWLDYTIVLSIQLHIETFQQLGAESVRMSSEVSWKLTYEKQQQKRQMEMHLIQTFTWSTLNKKSRQG